MSVQSVCFALTFFFQFSNPLAVQAAASTGSMPPPKMLEIVASPASTIQLDGDSTARKYTATAKSVAVKGKATSNTARAHGAAGKLPWIPQEIELTLPAADLSSGERTLDKHMHENLKAEQYPVIRMRLSHFDFSGGDSASGAKATGELTVAGVTKPIELEPAILVDGQKVNIKGKKRLLMSDFGITPPVLMMGTLKTKNEIDISFDVNLLPNPAQTKDSPKP
jgi:polyisoprenoid-binding protein YceI